jgi:anti-sigma factor RsiW
MSQPTSKCEQSEALHDYAFDELPVSERREMERHIAACAGCAAELDQLRLTTAALRILPDKEIPQRIAFISDKIFEPSAFARFFKSGWMGFSCAGMMAAALLFTAMHRPAAEIRTVVQTSAGADVNALVNQAVTKAVSQAVQEVRAEDAQITHAALAEAETKHEREHRMLIAAMQQNFEVMEKRLGTYTSLASLDAPQNSGAQ